MPTQVRINASQITGLKDQIDGLVKLTGRPQPLLKAYGITILKEIDAIFRAGGKPAWPPLRSSTLAAKRLGKGSKASTATPLQGLRSTFDASVGERELVVFSTSPIAPYHEDGTRGPYPIVAKNAKALAIPTAPLTLAGLGRSRPTGRGSFIFQPTAGKKPPKRFRGREGKAVVPFKGVIFRKRVMHPGLPARPMLPTTERLIEILTAAGEAFLAVVLKRRAT